MKLKAIERKGKSFLKTVLGALLKTRPVPMEDVRPDRIGRVLVVRQDERLGNLLLITPLLHELRRVLPRARITALASRRFGDILRGNDDIDTLLTFDKRELLRNPLRLVRLIRTLRRASFDLAIDCGPVDDISLNNSLLTYLSGAPLRLGHRRGESRPFLNLEVPVAGGERAEVDHHLDLLRYLFGDVPAGPMRLRLFPGEQDRAARRLRDRGLRDDDTVIGVHIGGRGGKRWAAENFRSLSEQLIFRFGVKILLFWGPNEEELIGRFRDRPVEGLLIAPLLTIRDLAAHIQRCAVFVCNDTGPMHLARAAGTPTVAIFRRANYQRYGPPDEHNRVIYRPDGEVAVDDVLSTVRELIEPRRPTRSS
jgi:heptosyltransferase-2